MKARKRRPVRLGGKDDFHHPGPGCLEGRGRKIVRAEALRNGLGQPPGLGLSAGNRATSVPAAAPVSVPDCSMRRIIGDLPAHHRPEPTAA